MQIQKLKSYFVEYMWIFCFCFLQWYNILFIPISWKKNKQKKTYEYNWTILTETYTIKDTEGVAC